MKIAFSLAIFAMFCIGGLAIIGEDANDTDGADSITCTINYVVDSTVYAVNEPITEEETVTLSDALPAGANASEGKEFSGWLYNGNVKTSITAVEGFTYTVTAVFSDIEYSIAFVYGEPVDVETYTYGEVAVVPTVTAPEGYTFAGWSNGTSTITEIPVVTADAIYTAVFNEVVVEYTVTFIVDDEPFGAVQTVAIASDIVYPYIEGYTWGDVVTNKETGNMTVTAVANPVADEYTVTFMVGEETTPFLVETVDAGDMAIEPAINGYTWDFDFDTAINENVTIDAKEIPNVSSTIGGLSTMNFTILIIFILALISVFGVIIYKQKKGDA